MTRYLAVSERSAVGHDPYDSELGGLSLASARLESTPRSDAPLFAALWSIPAGVAVDKSWVVFFQSLPQYHNALVNSAALVTAMLCPSLLWWNPPLSNIISVMCDYCRAHRRRFGEDLAVVD